MLGTGKNPVPFPGCPALIQKRMRETISWNAQAGSERRISSEMNWSGSRDCGEIPGFSGQPAFIQRGNPASAPSPILIAVPHAGRNYPPALLENLRYPGEASLRLEDRFVDRIAEAVSRRTGTVLQIATAPRAMLDLNRSADDVDWSMVAEGVPQGSVRHAAGRRARSGLGLVPRRLPGMGELWRERITQAELEERISAIHRPYHSALSSNLEAIRDRWGAALLLDMHSMPPLGPKRGTNRAPDFVIGDRFGASCGSNLSGAALEYFDRAHLLAAHNRPYAGGYVLDRHGAPSRGLHALQLEICRSTYLDHRLAEPGDCLDAVVTQIAGLITVLAEELSSSVQTSFSQAAE